MMKLHREARSYPDYAGVVTWCGLEVSRERIVKPADAETDRECKNCRKFHNAAVERQIEYHRVFDTR